MAVHRAMCSCVVFEEREFPPWGRMRKTPELRNVRALSIPDEPRVQKSVKPDCAHLNKCSDNRVRDRWDCFTPGRLQKQRAASCNSNNVHQTAHWDIKV